MAKIVVTGGAGFIGSHLVDKLIELDHEVKVVDNLLTGNKEFINEKAEFFEEDIRDLDKLKEIFKGADVVFHLAADPRLQKSIEDPISTHDINVNGTLNVLVAAKENNVGKVIFSSTCVVYGDRDQLPIDESCPTYPKNPYALHKLIGEHYCRLFHELYGFKSVALRYFNVFGPRKLNTGSYPMVIPIFLGQKQKGEKLTVVGDGEQTRDYVYVSDVVNANIKAWQSDIENGQPFNIGSNRQISVNKIAEIIGGETLNIPERPGEVRFIQADISKAKEILNWKPEVELEKGLEDLKKEWGV